MLDMFPFILVFCVLIAYADLGLGKPNNRKERRLMDILQRIRDMYPSLTRKQKGIADYLLKNPEDICYITLARLSRDTSASELTLLRFCKKIGCSSFLELKSEFREYTQDMIRQLSASAYFVPETADSGAGGKEELLLEISRQEADSVSEFISSFHPSQIIATANEIRNSRRIFIFAHDISKILGEFLEARLKLLSFPAILIDLDDLTQTQHYLHQLCEGDLVIFFSFPKYYFPMGSIAKKAAETRASILTITDSSASPAAKYSKLLLLCRTSTKMFYNTLTIPMAVLNLLSSCLVIDMVPAAERPDFKRNLSS